MGKVNVVIVDATGNKEQKVGLPDDIKCGIIMVKLIEKIKLPSVGPDGNPISYKFIHKVTGRQLLETQTLGEAGIKDGDVLRLQPEITAGANCPHCGMTNPEGATVCTLCGRNMMVSSTVRSEASGTPVLAFSVIGIICGAVSFILGTKVMAMDIGSYCSNKKYGGDAYTGIQNAVAMTANNVREVADICRFGMGALLMVFGVAVVCYFAIKISNLKR